MSSTYALKNTNYIVFYAILLTMLFEWPQTYNS